MGISRYKIDSPAIGLVPCVEITNGEPQKYTSIYILHIGQVFPGDIVLANAQVEITNNTTFNIQFTQALFIHGARNHYKNVTIDNIVGKIMDPCTFAGENVTPDMHHGFRSITGSYKIDWTGEAWINLVIEASSSTVNIKGYEQFKNTMKIDKDKEMFIVENYGGLSAIVFENENFFRKLFRKRHKLK